MDEARALELMKERKQSADSLTATLFGYGIVAMEEMQNKKSIREQENILYKEICDNICKHQDKAKTLEENYNLVNNTCPNCPLLKLM